MRIKLSEESRGTEEEYERSDGKIVFIWSRRENELVVEIRVWKSVDWFKPTVTESLFCNTMASCFQVNTHPVRMVTVERAADEEQRVRMDGYKLIHIRGTTADVQFIESSQHWMKGIPHRQTLGGYGNCIRSQGYSRGFGGGYCGHWLISNGVIYIHGNTTSGVRERAA